MAAFNSGAWFCAKVAACRGKCLVWSSFFKKQSICFVILNCLHECACTTVEDIFWNVLCCPSVGVDLLSNLGWSPCYKLRNLAKAGAKSCYERWLHTCAGNYSVSLWHERMARKLVNASCICNISQTASLCSKGLLPVAASAMPGYSTRVCAVDMVSTKLSFSGV